MLKINPKVILPKILYLFAFFSFIVSLFYRSRGFQTESLIWLIGGVVLVVLNFIDLFSIFNRNLWQTPTPPKVPSNEPGNIAAAALFIIYIISIFWKPLLHPKQLLGGYDMQFFYAYKCYWAQSLKDGDPALWNPYYHLGIPYWGWPIVGACSPFTPLYLVFPPSFAITLEYVIHLFLSAFGMYLLLRTLGSKWTGGIMAGMALP